MRILLIISSFICLPGGIVGNQTVSAPFWDYGDNAGPEKWNELYPSCNGSKQSPIDLFRAEVLRGYKYEDIRFYGYKTMIKNAYVENTGHTVQFVIEDPIQRFRGAGLDGVYKFLKMVFHWGTISEMGSEHAFSGIFSPLEMQLIHYNTQYEPEEALDKPDGLAVLSVLFNVAERSNVKLKPILDVLDEIIDENSITEIKDPFHLIDFLPTSSKDYYRYQGSLTSPPCHESVVWIIFKGKLTISERQLGKFRLLKKSSGNDLGNNFRPVNPVNERIVVLYSSPTSTTPNFRYNDDDDDDDDHDHDHDTGIKIKIKVKDKSKDKDKHKDKDKDKHKDKDKDKHKDKDKSKDKHKDSKISIKIKSKGGKSVGNAVLNPTTLLILISLIISLYSFV